MDDVKSLFERQTKWQQTRARLSWTEKLHMAEILREAALAMGSSNRQSKMQSDNEVGGFKEKGSGQKTF